MKWRGVRPFAWQWVLLIALCAGIAVSHADEAANSFRTAILPILTKAGCNAGACHGAAVGQGGFQLSLLGYDPELDFARITRELSGRRIDLANPEASLLLRKGSHQIEHEGGRRLRRSEKEYAILRDWIKAGAPYGSHTLAVTNLAVTPSEIFAEKLSATFPLKVVATFNNGAQQDVTSLALYTSNDDAIAEALPSGEVIIRGHGLTSVMIRFSGEVAATRIAAPLSDHPVDLSEFPVRNYIDTHIRSSLAKLRAPAASLASHPEFLRRVFLDMLGRLPSEQEAFAHLSSKDSPRAREQLIEALLKRDDFVDYWTMLFADLLLLGNKKSDGKAAGVYYDWLRARIADNTALDEIARSLLTAQGKITEVGPANFYTLASDPRDLSEHVSRIFLGTQIACARCHAHPTDRWTQDDYYRFAAYFSGVTQEGGLVKARANGRLEDAKGKVVTPKPLGGSARIHTDDAQDPRGELAAWVTAKHNPRFARSIANRVWKQLLGRGLVEPVDDLRSTNPASHPELLDALAEDFIKSGYDLRHLIRTIASSGTYQLSSKPPTSSAQNDRLFASALLKPLPAQVQVDAVADVTGVRDTFAAQPSATRAVQLISASAPSYTLDVLGRCGRETACETAGQSGGGLAQALHFINGSLINEKLQGGFVDEVTAAKTSPPEIVERLYLRAFSRYPTGQERAAWESLIVNASDRRAAVEDLLWTVLNSQEFAFNH